MTRMLRRIERSVARAGWTVLGSLRRRRKPVDDLGDIRRILFVRSDRIGDAIASTPALAALRARFPDAEIDIVLGRKNAAVAPLLPFVDRIFVAADLASRLKVIRAMRRCRYDIAINPFRSQSTTATLLTVLSGARIRIGLATSAAELYDIVVPMPAAPLHFVRRYLTPLAALGVAMPPDDAIRLSIVLTREARAAARAAVGDPSHATAPLAMVNISCSATEKFWGVDNFARLAKEIRAGGLDVRIVAAPGDEALLEAVAAASGVPLMPTRASLMEFAGILSCADLIVTPDTSVVHIAASLGKPVVSLAPSAMHVLEWHPWGVSYRTLSHGSGIADIPYADVAAAVRSLVREVFPQIVHEPSGSAR